MKKTLATLLCLSTLLSAGCSAKVPPVTDPIVTTEATEPTKPGAAYFLRFGALLKGDTNACLLTASHLPAAL